MWLPLQGQILRSLPLKGHIMCSRTTTVTMKTDFELYVSDFELYVIYGIVS